MPVLDDAPKRLVRLFRRSAIADLPTLERVLGTTSRTTVYRTISALGYLTSSSHAGRFYTLEDVPEFDADGLWRHGDVLFSRYGTLRETIVRLVEQAPAGRTHAELRERLLLRVQDTLRDLTEDGKIDRVRIERLFVYVSMEQALARAQIARRQETAEQAAAEAPAGDIAVLEVLLEVIHGAGAWVAPRVVSRRLQARGVSVNPEQVEGVYREYGIVKKGRHSRSR
jgi:hypothetical protein